MLKHRGFLYSSSVTHWNSVILIDQSKVDTYLIITIGALAIMDIHQNVIH